MKQVKLNRDSWHFKYYINVIGSNPPKSLCPYFWSLFALVLFSPLIFFIYGLFKFSDFFSAKMDKFLPKKESISFKSDEDWRNYFENQKQNEIKRKEYWNKMTPKIILISKWVLVPLVLISLSYLIFFVGNKIGWYELLIKTTIIVVFIVFVFSLIAFIDTISEKMNTTFKKIWRFINPFKWSLTQIVSGMIYAWYKKSCPLIEWEGEDPLMEESYS